jgi:hypothetical protein
LLGEGLNLKQWFLNNAKQYLAQQIQPNLPLFEQVLTKEGK